MDAMAAIVPAMQASGVSEAGALVLQFAWNNAILEQNCWYDLR